MADKTQKFKEALAKKVDELEKLLASKEFSFEDLVEMQEKLGNELEQELNQEEFRILNSIDSESSGDSNLQKLGQKIANTLAIDDVVYDKDDTKLTEAVELQQPSLQKKEALENIKKLTPPINNPPPRQHILEAIRKADGLPDENKNKMIQFLSVDFRDEQTSEDKDNGAVDYTPNVRVADFLKWAEEQDQQKAELKKLKEEKEIEDKTLKRRDKFLGRGDSELEDSFSESNGKRPLIVKQSGDDAGETIYVDANDPRVIGKPREPVPEYIEKQPEKPREIFKIKDVPPRLLQPMSQPEFTKEEETKFAEMEKEHIAAEEEAAQLNPKLNPLGGKKRRKKTKKKKKSKKRKTKRRYKTGKRN